MTRHVSEKRRDEAKIRHIGKERISRAGFPMKIVQYRKQEDIDVQFGDGAISQHIDIKHFQAGTVAHPCIHTSVAHGRKVVRKGSIFADFSLEFIAFEDTGNETAPVYYACSCQKCGYSNILTPQEMLEHRNTNCGL